MVKPNILLFYLLYVKNDINEFIQEVHIVREPGEKLGLSIRGGLGGFPGNPDNSKDMGIFISNVSCLLKCCYFFYCLLMKSLVF